MYSIYTMKITFEKDSIKEKKLRELFLKIKEKIKKWNVWWKIPYKEMLYFTWIFCIVYVIIFLPVFKIDFSFYSIIIWVILYFLISWIFLLLFNIINFNKKEIWKIYEWIKDLNFEDISFNSIYIWTNNTTISESKNFLNYWIIEIKKGEEVLFWLESDLKYEKEFEEMSDDEKIDYFLNSNLNKVIRTEKIIQTNRIKIFFFQLLMFILACIVWFFTLLIINDLVKFSNCWSLTFNQKFDLVYNYNHESKTILEKYCDSKIDNIKNDDKYKKLVNLIKEEKNNWCYLFDEYDLNDILEENKFYNWWFEKLQNIFKINSNELSFDEQYQQVYNAIKFNCLKYYFDNISEELWLYWKFKDSKINTIEELEDHIKVLKKIRRFEISNKHK